MLGENYIFSFVECGMLITIYTPAGTGLAGMRQRDLIQWYVSQQNDKNSYSSMEEAAAEVNKVKAIIEVTLGYLCSTIVLINIFPMQN